MLHISLLLAILLAPPALAAADEQTDTSPPLTTTSVETFKADEDEDEETITNPPPTPLRPSSLTPREKIVLEDDFVCHPSRVLTAITGGILGTGGAFIGLLVGGIISIPACLCSVNMYGAVERCVKKGWRIGWGLGHGRCGG